eukprot:jgi/Psemu1/61604/gm1.61604_g
MVDPSVNCRSLLLLHKIKITESNHLSSSLFFARSPKQQVITRPTTQPSVRSYDHSILRFIYIYDSIDL